MEDKKLLYLVLIVCMLSTLIPAVIVSATAPVMTTLVNTTFDGLSNELPVLSSAAATSNTNFLRKHLTSGYTAKYESDVLKLITGTANDLRIKAADGTTSTGLKQEITNNVLVVDTRMKVSQIDNLTNAKLQLAFNNQANSNATAPGIWLGLADTGTVGFVYKNNSYRTATGGPALAAGQYYNIRFIMDLSNNTTGAIDYYVDGLKLTPAESGNGRYDLLKGTDGTTSLKSLVDNRSTNKLFLNYVPSTSTGRDIFTFTTKNSTQGEMDVDYLKISQTNSTARIVALNQSSITLATGNTSTLSVTSVKTSANVNVSGDYATRWYSMDESIATVDQSGVVTAVGIGNTYVCAEVDGVAIARCRVGVGKAVDLEFFNQLDLSKPELSQVVYYLNQNCFYEALEEYKNIFVDRVSKMHLGTLPPQNHYPPDSLMGDEVRIMHGTDIRNLGKVGELDWYGLKTDNYKSGWNFHQLMMWHPQTLLETFAANPQEKVNYLKRWAEIWDDYAVNNYAQYNIARNNSGIKAYFDANKLEWFDMQYKQPLMIAWQKNNCIAQLIYGIQADPQMWKKTVSGIQLANILSNLGNVLIELQTYDGVPNQITEAVSGSLKSTLLVPEFYKAKKWEADLTGAMSNLSTFGFMLDGTNSETSLNYNTGTINSCLEICKFYTENNIPMPDGIKRLYDVLDAGGKFIANMVTPVGSNIVMCKGGSPTTFLSDWLGKNNTPAYKSLFLPYGGEVFLRSGWTQNDSLLYMYTGRKGNGHEEADGNGIQFTALRKNILINNQGEGDYYGSSKDSNTLNIDGMQQPLIAVAQQAPYNKPINARFLAGNAFDYAEGYYNYGYGSTYSTIDVPKEELTHRRSLIALKKYGVYAVIDKAFAGGGHSYTVNWHFEKDYNENNVEVSNNLIKTTSASLPNLYIYQAMAPQANLSNNKYYGYIDGYVKKGFQNKGNGYSPVDAPNNLVETTWSGSGNQVLLSVLAPTNGTSDPISVIDNSTADYAMLSLNDAKIFASKNNTSNFVFNNVNVNAEMLAIYKENSVTKGMILGCNSFKIDGIEQSLYNVDFEFEIGNSFVQTPIRVPTGFAWVNGENGSFAPNYAPQAAVENEISERELLAWENFDYPDGTLLNSLSKTQGNGFKSGYLPYESTVLAISDNYAINNGVLNWDGQNKTYIKRELDKNYNENTDTTYYISFDVKFNANVTNTSTLKFGFGSTTHTTPTFGVQQGKPYARIHSSGNFYGDTMLSKDTWYTGKCKIVSDKSGNDKLYYKLYPKGTIEPDWQVTHSYNVNMSADYLWLDANIAFSLDNFVIENDSLVVDEINNTLKLYQIYNDSFWENSFRRLLGKITQLPCYEQYLQYLPQNNKQNISVVEAVTEGNLLKELSLKSVGYNGSFNLIDVERDNDKIKQIRVKTDFITKGSITNVNINRPISDTIYIWNSSLAPLGDIVKIGAIK